MGVDERGTGCLFALDPDGSTKRRVCGAGGLRAGEVTAPGLGSGYGLDAGGGLYVLLPGLESFRSIQGAAGPLAVTAEGVVLVGGERLLAVAPQTLPQQSPVIWRAETRPTDIVVAGDGIVYVLSFNELAAFRSDGSRQWSVRVAGSGPGRLGIDGTGTLYAALEHDLTAVSREGVVLWSRNSATPAPRGVGEGANAAYWGGDGKVLAFDSWGHALWAFTPGSPLASAPVVGPDGTIYITEVDGSVCALGADGRERHAFRLDAAAGRPAVGHDGLYVITTVGHLLPVPF
jgi:outer membrane protein assembly factor BamB